MKPTNQEMNETAIYNSFFDFLKKNKDRIFRFWVYKRIFTPLEQEKKYVLIDLTQQATISCNRPKYWTALMR